MGHAAQTRAEARAAMIDRWDAERRADPAVSRMILTQLNKEVQMLNQAARERLVAQGELGENIAVRTERGIRQFADNDRILFLKNEREMGVKNGTLGTLAKAAPDGMALRLHDGGAGPVPPQHIAHGAPTGRGESRER